jgi:lipoate---protein ligase
MHLHLLDLTLPTAAENLALDEALLDAAEGGELVEEVLRIWESPDPIVVIGRSSKLADEVHGEACRAAGVPILRRSSGGSAIVAGPGCLMYAVVLRYAGREHFRLVNEAHQHMLGMIKRALDPLVANIQQLGISDLAVDEKKFSGNSLRCKRDHLLYHGTLLYSFDLALIDRFVKMPPREPAYRSQRVHQEFVTNLHLSVSSLRQALCCVFDAHEPLLNWPKARTTLLATSRYSQSGWNLSR